MDKRGGGGSLCKVLHPTLARGRGARMTQGGANAPPRPSLNTSLCWVVRYSDIGTGMARYSDIIGTEWYSDIGTGVARYSDI